MDSLDLCNGIRMESEGVVENNIPLDCLPTKIQDMVLMLARQENYSIEYTMASLLIAASSAIGNSTKIHIRGGWKSSPILYMILVGRPGMGKTPPLDYALYPSLYTHIHLVNGRSVHKRYEAVTGILFHKVLAYGF